MKLALVMGFAFSDQRDEELELGKLGAKVRVSRLDESAFMGEVS